MRDTFVKTLLKEARKDSNIILMTGDLGFGVLDEFQKELQKARFLFLPNITDASPRVITEAMCYDLRLLINYDIIGGWKYVTPETGEFFHDEFDIEKALEKLTKNMDRYQPRKHFVEKYGKERFFTRLKKGLLIHER